MRTDELPAIAPLRSADEVVHGPWRIVGTLGIGGMGVVHEAVDGANRRAALKVVSPALAGDPAFLARFRREVEVARRVSAVGTAAVLDADPDAARPWLAVELVPGPTLARRISDAGALPFGELWAFAAATAHTLAQVHAAGVVHRDLKPSNVILGPSGPCIIDFGIATAAEVSPLTATGWAVGTAGWMSPEQVSGACVSAASDVFGWAALVAFAATGRPPFGSGRPEALAYRIVHGEADLAGVPSHLGDILRRALVVDPTARPTMDEVALRLRAREPITVARPVDATRLTRSAPIAPPPPPPPSPVAGEPRRWAWPAAVAATALILAAGIVLGAQIADGEAIGDSPAAAPARPADEAAPDPDAATPPSMTPERPATPNPNDEGDEARPPSPAWAAAVLANELGVPAELFECTPVASATFQCWSIFDLVALEVAMLPDGSATIRMPQIGF